MIKMALAFQIQTPVKIWVYPLFPNTHSIIIILRLNLKSMKGPHSILLSFVLIVGFARISFAVKRVTHCLRWRVTNFSVYYKTRKRWPAGKGHVQTLTKVRKMTLRMMRKLPESKYTKGVNNDDYLLYM